jgi:hypothetical protein
MSAHMPRRTALLLLILATGLLWPASTAAAPSAPQGGPAPTNACFIRGIYRDVLLRVPDGLEVSNGLAFLGSHTNEEYASTLLTGDEYRTLLIRDWYQKFLGRPASGGEIGTWLSSFHSGAKDEEILAVIFGSNEYFVQSRVGGTNTGFVTAIYQDLLGRSPSISERNLWVNRLDGHTVTRPQVATAILTSMEYRNLIIQDWYHRFLGRAASNGEVSTWQSSLSGGATDEYVIANVLGSVEYFSRAGLCTTYLPLVRR